MTELHLMAQMLERQGHKVIIEYFENIQIYKMSISGWYIRTDIQFIFNKEGKFQYITSR